ncbi:MAG: diguanylate cyclase [Pyrinomonadaceae bacterium]
MSKPNRPQRELRPALIFLSGELLAVPIPLERGEVVLGRAVESDVRINDTKVSRQHARITTVQTGETGETNYLLTDLNAKNGTYLNGQKITQEILQNGDKITIGNNILRFEMLDEIDREYQHLIRRLLSHDDLTGLLSSRSFFSELRREVSNSADRQREFCVLMVDIDYFKNVNDTYGHLTGSKTLEEIGYCITQILRSGDAAARFGGEEFAAFLLDANLAQGIVAAERIRQTIENRGFSVIKLGKTVYSHRITISIGVATFPADSSDPIELVEMADSALYRAKRAGRNRVCAYRELSAEDSKEKLSPRQE